MTVSKKKWSKSICKNHQFKSICDIATRPIMDLCLTAEHKPGLLLSRRWWEQPTLDILGIRAGNTSAEVGRETEMTRRTRDNQMEI